MQPLPSEPCQPKVSCKTAEGGNEKPFQAFGKRYRISWLLVFWVENTLGARCRGRAGDAVGGDSSSLGHVYNTFKCELNGEDTHLREIYL